MSTYYVPASGNTKCGDWVLTVIQKRLTYKHYLVDPFWVAIGLNLEEWIGFWLAKKDREDILVAEKYDYTHGNKKVKSKKCNTMEIYQV